MGAIVDTLILSPEELSVLQNEYPQCLTINLTNTDRVFQHYKVIIGGEDEDNYYDFLVDNGTAMSSQKFYARIRSDKTFAQKMDSRMRAIQGDED